MKTKLLLAVILAFTSVVSFAKYKVSPYVAWGAYAKIKEQGVCGEVGVVLPVYKFISAGIFCEAYTPHLTTLDAYYGVRGNFWLFNKKQSGKIYAQGTLNAVYDKTFYYSIGYSHNIPINKHLSAQLVPYFASNTAKQFTDGSFGGVVFFTYSF